MCVYKYTTHILSNIVSYNIGAKFMDGAAEAMPTATAVRDYIARGPHELTLVEGNAVELCEGNSEEVKDGWLMGVSDRKRGVFPRECVRMAGDENNDNNSIVEQAGGQSGERSRPKRADDVSNSLKESARETSEPYAVIELESALETKDILSDFSLGKRYSKYASDRVDAEMKKVEDRIENQSMKSFRVGVRMRAGPAVVHEARMKHKQDDDVEDPFSLLAFKNVKIDDTDGVEIIRVKVLARHCATSWNHANRQANASPTPRQWGCYAVECPLPSSLGTQAKNIMAFCKKNIGELVAIDETGNRLSIEDEDHALYQNSESNPLNGSDTCVAHVLHHCSVLQEIEDGCADKQGSIDLSHRGLEEMPKNLLGDGTPTVLNLSHNQLSRIPSQYFLDTERSRLRSLHSLLLSNNGLRLLPAGLEELTSLKVLSLSNNQISELPWEIAKLSGLKVLFLDGNRLSGLPWEFRSLTNLQELRLGCNDLDSFPSRILGLRELEQLGLERNRIPSLPSTIGNSGDLPNLKSLDMTSNLVTYLPDGIGTLVGLNRLFLAANRITYIPESWDVLQHRLKIISLGGNRGLRSPAWVESVPMHD